MPVHPFVRIARAWADQGSDIFRGYHIYAERRLNCIIRRSDRRDGNRTRSEVSKNMRRSWSRKCDDRISTRNRSGLVTKNICVRSRWDVDGEHRSTSSIYLLDCFRVKPRQRGTKSRPEDRIDENLATKYR